MSAPDRRDDDVHKVQPEGFAPSIAARTQALLDLVERHRAEQCQAVLAQAREQADAAMSQARQRARALMRETFVEERQRAQLRIAAAEAELATRRRLAAQQRAEGLLGQAWQRLPDALLARWRDPQLRSRWVQAALQAAMQALPAGAWQLHHSDQWPEAERDALADRLPPGSTFVADARIPAGLRITAAGNVIDATAVGLLADRDEIGGRLIGLLEDPQ